MIVQVPGVNVVMSSRISYADMKVVELPIDQLAQLVGNSYDPMSA
jgi:hypothetical protein